MKRLQLEDLSKQLGYSKTLISMVLNSKGDQYGISKKTQAFVLDAAAKLNYAPNRFAKALRMGKSNFIGLILPDINNFFYSAIAKSIENTLSEQGYNLIVRSTDENEEKEKMLVNMMLNQHDVDGLIIASAFKSAVFYEQSPYSKIPIVFIDRILPLFQAHYVIMDNHGGAYEIVNHVIKTGYKKIICFSHAASVSDIEDCLNGYKDAIEKNKLTYNEGCIKIIRCENTEEDIEKTLRDMINANTEPDAIFALNNRIAIILLKVLKKKEFEKISKVKIACFGDNEIFNFVENPVISISQPVQEIGKDASLLILDVISGKQMHKSNIVLATTLIVR